MVVPVYADTLPSVCILMFWLTKEETGSGGGAFPPANDSAQVKHRDWTALRPERAVDVDVEARKRKYSPSKVKAQMDKACSKIRLNLKEMKSKAELTCFLLDR